MASISITATSPISWTDITPAGGSGQPFFGLAVNADASLIAASDNTSFWTTATQGALIPWAQWPNAPGSSAIAVSDTAVLGAGPGPSFAGLSTDYDGVNYKTIFAANASYLTAPRVPSPPLNTLIAQYAATYQIDVDTFARQLYRESHWDPNITASDGGKGIAQWTPPYPTGYNIQPFVPSNAIQNAAAYLRQFMNMFSNNLGLAMAAYNAGGGTVQHYLSNGDINDFTVGTQLYVQNLTGHTIEEWAAAGYKIIAANHQTGNIAVSSNTASSWKDQLPAPGAMPGACVATNGSGADGAAGGVAALWITRSLGAIS